MTTPRINADAMSRAVDEQAARRAAPAAAPTTKAQKDLDDLLILFVSYVD